MTTSEDGVTVTEIDPEYFVSWNRVDTAGKLLDWICHFIEKGLKGETIYGFVQLANEHFNKKLIEYGA